MHLNTSKRPDKGLLYKITQPNCSVVTACGCNVNKTTDSSTTGEPDVEIEAFFYIVVVIVFYATSIVLLLVKYARNDDEEKNLKYQYSEFVKRERFQAPRYKNKLALERTKAFLHALEANGGLVFNCPVITISNFNEDGDSELCTVSGLLSKPLQDGSMTGIRSNTDGEYSSASALWTENIERSTSLCSLSFDTGLGFGCLDNLKDGECVDVSSERAKRKYQFEKSHSI